MLKKSASQSSADYRYQWISSGILETTAIIGNLSFGRRRPGQNLSFLPKPTIFGAFLDVKSRLIFDDEGVVDKSYMDGDNLIWIRVGSWNGK